MSRTSLFDYVTTQFLICEEQKPNNGEDSGLIALGQSAGLACVFDGCGGLGAMTYPARDGKTGAYMASRSVANAVLRWFHRADGKLTDEYLDELRPAIDDGLGQCYREAGNPAIRIKGSMVRAFPSTMAAVVYRPSEPDCQRIHTTHIWAGDSRTYLLTAQGLVQVSADDVKGEDALSNLSNDGVLTNVLSADKPYTLHRKTVELVGPVIVFAATDGCFGYLSSPMMFEAVLLEELLQAENVAQWESGLRERFRSTAGDDYTLALTAFGYGSFTEMQNAYLQRFRYVKGIADEFERSDADGRMRIWQSYQKEYYRLKGRTEA